MISDPATAKRVSDLLLEAFCRVDESCGLVRASAPPDEVRAYMAATGHVVGAITLDVLEPLYERHPSLKPANWDD
jgi:hypothetical protein